MFRDVSLNKGVVTRRTLQSNAKRETGVAERGCDFPTTWPLYSAQDSQFLATKWYSYESWPHLQLPYLIQLDNASFRCPVPSKPLSVHPHSWGIPQSMVQCHDEQQNSKHPHGSDEKLRCFHFRNISGLWWERGKANLHYSMTRK